VVEKLAAVEAFVRGPVAPLAGAALTDPRIAIVRDDVAEVIARERDVDAILLDVDNGPNWASFRSNARLYGASGLAEAMASLAFGGISAVWSGYAADAFVSRIRSAGMQALIVPMKERGVVRARAYVGRKLARDGGA
jgi:spermidine synthase